VIFWRIAEIAQSPFPRIHDRNQKTKPVLRERPLSDAETDERRL